MFAFPYQHLTLNLSQAELSLLLPPRLYLLAGSQASPHFQPGWKLRLQTFPLLPFCTPHRHTCQLSAGLWQPLWKSFLLRLHLLQRILPLVPCCLPLGASFLMLLFRSGERKSSYTPWPKLSLASNLEEAVIWDVPGHIAGGFLSFLMLQRELEVCTEAGWIIIYCPGLQFGEESGLDLALCIWTSVPCLNHHHAQAPHPQPTCSITIMPARPFQAPAQTYIQTLSSLSTLKDTSSGAALKTHLAHVLTSQKVQRHLGRGQPSTLSAPTYTKVHCCHLEKICLTLRKNFLLCIFGFSQLYWGILTSKIVRYIKCAVMIYVCIVEGFLLSS